MKTMLSKIRIISEILKDIGAPVSHYKAMKKPDKYIVWAEDSEGSSVEGDDQKTAQSIQGTIDFYTKEDMDEIIDRIQEALVKNRVSFYLNSIQYEDETEFIHYEWVWEVG